MLQWRGEVKIRWKASWPQTGIELTTTRLWVLHAHQWATRADQRLEEGQMKESDTDPLTLPLQLKTKTILCMPKRRLKQYIGLVIKIIAIQLQFIVCVPYSASIDRWPWMIYSTWLSIVSTTWSIDSCPIDRSIDSAAWSIDRADRSIAHNI